MALRDLPGLRESLKGKTALAIGPGIPRGPETGALIGELLSGLDGSCAAVLDAEVFLPLRRYQFVFNDPPDIVYGEPSVGYRFGAAGGLVFR